MKKIESNKEKIMCFIIIFLFFLCGTYIYNSDFVSTWDSYSEVLPIGKLLQAQTSNPNFGGFMGIYTEEWGDTENYTIYLEDKDLSQYEFKTYADQIGIQGTIFGIINRIMYLIHLNPHMRLGIIYFINAFVSCLMWAILIYGVGKIYGEWAMIGSMISLMPMYYFFRTLHNLYWVMGIRLLPTVVMLLLVYKWNKTGVWGKRYYLYIFIAMLFCLCHTFEFVTMEMILCVTPLCIYLYKLRNIREIKKLILSGIMCIIAFGASIGIWILQCYKYFGNIETALNHVWWIAGSRSGLDAIDGEGFSELGQSITAWDVVSAYLYGDASNIWGHIKLIYLVIIVFLLYLLKVALTKKLGNTETSSYEYSIVLLLVLCFLASISWMVISQGHAYHHTSLVITLWFYAFVPALGAFAGMNIKSIIYMMGVQHKE